MKQVIITALTKAGHQPQCTAGIFLNPYKTSGGPCTIETRFPDQHWALTCPGPQQGWGAEPVVQAQVSWTLRPSHDHRQEALQQL